jgi:hypothetical protein
MDLRRFLLNISVGSVLVVIGIEVWDFMGLLPLRMREAATWVSVIMMVAGILSLAIWAAIVLWPIVRDRFSRRDPSP